MFHKKTLFILGAGASAPYGLPVGKSLRQLIIQFGRGQSLDTGQKGLRERLDREIKRDCRNVSLLTEFTEAFNTSPGLSIDAFLEKRPHFDRIGKAILGGILLEHESSKKLLEPPEDHWYEWLAKHLDLSASTPEESNASFISFNYDRSFEQYLYMATHSLCDDKKVAAKFVRQLEIDHVYGSLGLLPALRTSESLDELGPEYGSMVSYDLLDKFTKTIQLMASDGRDKEDKQKPLRDKVRAAEVIIFLGFGFDVLNMRRLGFPMRADRHHDGTPKNSSVFWEGGAEAVTRPTVVASGYGFLGSEHDEITSRRLNHPDVGLPDPRRMRISTSKSLDTLRENINVIEAWQQ